MKGINMETRKPESANEVRSRLSEIIQIADENVLNVCRSRAVEQDVLDLIDHELSPRR